MSCIGVWPTRRGLVAVGTGTPSQPLRVASTDEAAHALLAYLETVHRGASFELVLPNRIGRAAPVARVALVSGISLWLAPDALIDDIRTVSGLARAPAPRTAAALARMPNAPAFRAQLLRVGPSDQRQLALW